MMENSQPALGTSGGGKEPSIDPVKAEGILAEVSRKNKVSSKLWQQRWGFYLEKKEIMKEEAQNLGFTLEDYRFAVESVSGKPEPKKCPVEIDISPTPLPTTSSGMIGRRVKCTLERYGPLVMTPQSYPIHPPLPPGQVYDPYKQTMMFLGSVTGDPISHKLPPLCKEVPNEVWTEPRKLAVTPFCQETLQYALSR